MQKKTADQLHTERRRGWILKLLDEQRPEPIELAVLSQSLDSLNFPLGRRSLAREVDYLRSLGAIRVFPLGANEEMSNVDQARLVQRYLNSETDSEMGLSLCVRMTLLGVNFQEKLIELDGVSRVE